MHPAFSVIFFTVSSGAGYGLLAMLAIRLYVERLPQNIWFSWAGFFVAFALISFGLLSSFAHLGHPERALKAFSQWRSSWLSREGVVAVLTYVPGGIIAIAWLLIPDIRNSSANPVWLDIAALVTIVFAVVTVYCTSMIYASLRTIPHWHNGHTVIGYLVHAAMSGAVLYVFLSSLFGAASTSVMWSALVLLAVGFFAKTAFWRYVDSAPPVATAESATGLTGFGTVRPLDPPHTSANYLQKEMGYQIARKHAARLRRIAMILCYGAPFIALVLAGQADGWGNMLLSAVAVIAMTIGLLTERWLFFAEAKHSVMLYYGATSV